MPAADQEDKDMEALMGALDAEGEQAEATIKSLSDAASAEESLVNESGIAPPKSGGAEPAPAKTAEEEQKAKDEAEAAAEAQRAQEQPKATEDRNRVYLHDGLSTERKALIQVMADNPDLSTEQAEELVAKRLEGIKDDPEVEVSASERLQTAKDRLAEVNAKIIAKDKDFKHDDEWEALVKEKDQLLVDVPELDLAARIESSRSNSLQADIAAAEAKAHELVPALADDTSPEYAQAAGRVAQLCALKDGGKALPVIEVDGVKHTLDPDNPNLPVLVAHEIAQASKKEKQATEATPVAPEQRPAVKRQLVPTPAASPVSATHKPQPEGAETKVSLKDRAAAVTDYASLGKLLDDEGTSWNTGNSRFAKRVL